MTGGTISEATIDHVVRTIAERFHPVRIILFGSYARGEARADSDLDLFVELDDPDLPPRGRSLPMHLAFDPYPCPLDIVVYTPAETAHWSQAAASLAATVLREGKVLFERR